MTLYRLLLRLLPRRRRERDGEAMAAVFDDLRRATRLEEGRLALGVLWMKETGGLMKFSLRERFGRRQTAVDSPQPPRGGWDFASELKWAWRAVRARGWRAGLAVALLAVALAANTIVFSAADALVFNRVPYRELDRLAWLGTASPQTLAIWRDQHDLFDGIHGYITRPVFVVAQDQPAIIDVADVTPGLLEMLGASPAWGRTITEADAHETSAEVVVISERLARARYGAPSAAVGQRMKTTEKDLFVVGVMPDWFRFPAGRYDIWRALDIQSGRFRFVWLVARVAPEQSMAAIAEAAKARGGQIGARLAETQPLNRSRIQTEPRRLLLIIVGAALCLLLTACANVASLELTGVVNRVRSFGIKAALGASRASLVRGALLEGAFILSPAVLIAAGLAKVGADVLAAQMPDRVFDSMNPIDVDGRALAFMVAAAAATWIVVSAPLAVFSSRRTVLDAVRAEGRSLSASKWGARLRGVLTSAEVALAVLLLAAGLLYARTYQSLLAIDRGFDTRNLAVLSLTLPTQSYPTAGSKRLLEDQVTQRLRGRLDVVDIAGGSLPPSQGEAHQGTALQVDGLPVGRPGLSIGVNRVDESTFRTLRIPLRAGRLLDASASATDAVIDESFARAFWPNGDAVGHQFKPSNAFPVMTVVGVAGHVRNDRDTWAGPSEQHFRIYVLRQPPVDRPSGSKMITDQPLFGLIEFAVRLDPLARPQDLFADVRAIDSRFRLSLRSMDEIYASRFDDTLLATRIVGGFASLTFVLAIVGVYGVMAFLVAGRTREIGIRMALGADGRDISRLVLKSSVTMVAIGASLGVAGALIASRWTGSQFFGVTATAPGTYVLVTAVVVATSILATWRPARAAARVDPAITLRAD